MYRWYPDLIKIPLGSSSHMSMMEYLYPPYTRTRSRRRIQQGTCHSIPPSYLLVLIRVMGGPAYPGSCEHPFVFMCMLLVSDRVSSDPKYYVGVGYYLDFGRYKTHHVGWYPIVCIPLDIPRDRATRECACTIFQYWPRLPKSPI